jgi:hypothetical protein
VEVETENETLISSDCDRGAWVEESEIASPMGCGRGVSVEESVSASGCMRRYALI